MIFKFYLEDEIWRPLEDGAPWMSGPTGGPWPPWPPCQHASAAYNMLRKMQTSLATMKHFTYTINMQSNPRSQLVQLLVVASNFSIMYTYSLGQLFGSERNIYSRYKVKDIPGLMQNHLLCMGGYQHIDTWKQRPTHYWFLTARHNDRKLKRQK